MQAYRLETIVPQNGELRLSQLPFRPGDRIEVIVLAQSLAQSPMNSFPLKGTVIQFDEPLEPVGMDDWSVLQ